MKRFAIAAALLAGLAGEGRGELIDDSPPARYDPERGNFWRDLISPHKDEVESLVAKARQSINRADMALYSDDDPTGTERIRFYREVYAMLKYARKLAPDDLEVLKLLGHAADEHGRTREAIEAYQTAIDLVGAEKAGSEVTGRLGMIYLRLGKTDDAIRYLRAAQAPVVSGLPYTAHVLVHLSNAYAARGQMTDAIDVLANSIPTQVQYYPNEILLLTFALAVQYDRDEQPSAAFETLDRVQTVLQGQLAQMAQSQLAGMRFAPAADRHYYFALLWEVSGHYAEARAEWSTYAAAGKQPYRRRALEHIAAIDALRRAPPPDLVNSPYGPQVPYRPRRRHP